jgi:hypothetical protein
MQIVKPKTFFKISLLAVMLISCEMVDEDYANTSDLLMGSWINPQYEDSIVTYSKATELLTDQYGFTFNVDYSFIERKNAGWCGTPPITYADFTGVRIENDSIVDISVDYWGGTAEYKWKVLSIDNQAMKIIQLSADYNFEN